MNRVAYYAQKKDFVVDVRRELFIDKMIEGAKRNHIGGAINELRSWGNNADKIRNILEEGNVPDDVIVSFEYKVPGCFERIDCMLYGKGKNEKDNVVHIELKQWDNQGVSELYNTGVFKVDAFTGGSFRAVCHPSQQVKNYQEHLTNRVAELQNDYTELDGMAYCYNYSSNKNPNALFADHYRTILDECSLYSKDQIDQLSARLNYLLYYGTGLSIFNRVINSEIRQAPKLIDAAANMLKGVSEFSLMQDQITASNTIAACVSTALGKNVKTVIVIKGGPGTGKTVIALHVLASMAQKGIIKNMYFTTRSKALRESLKQRLREISINNGTTSASDLIANIFSFKPYYYKENDVDLLLVDEAHRVQKSANHMVDRFYEQTYLSQVESLIYCSKVCVFFIDDKQSIKTDEIGNSQDIIDTAKNYRTTILDYTHTKFYGDLLKCKKKLTKAIEERDAISRIPGTNQNILSSLDENISELRRQLTKEDCLHNVKSNLQSDVNIIEMELKSQFRCNGSNNYLDWLDEVLYLSGSDVKTTFSSDDYIFEFFDSPDELYKKIRSVDKSSGNGDKVARVAAGYCWRWSTELTRDGDLKKDVIIGSFEMPWETNNIQARNEYRDRYASSADTWAIEDAGINQIGCIFSIQGFELDYIGVIIGPDIKYDNASDSLVGVPGKNVAVKCQDNIIYTRHIRNAYRVLLSRGRLGCFVYCCDPEVGRFMQKCLKR